MMIQSLKDKELITSAPSGITGIMTSLDRFTDSKTKRGCLSVCLFILRELDNRSKRRILLFCDE